MELEILLDISAIMLDILINKFNAGQLTYDEFINNTELKTSFIKENINYVTIPKQRENIELLLREYEQRLTLNPQSLRTSSNL